MKWKTLRAPTCTWYNLLHRIVISNNRTQIIITIIVAFTAAMTTVFSYWTSSRSSVSAVIAPNKASRRKTLGHIQTSTNINLSTVNMILDKTALKNREDIKYVTTNHILYNLNRTELIMCDVNCKRIIDW